MKMMSAESVSLFLRRALRFALGKPGHRLQRRGNPESAGPLMVLSNKYSRESARPGS
jgi:hypothetical protein